MLKTTPIPVPRHSTQPLPAGFEYQPDFLTLIEERRLVEAMEPLPFKEFEFHSYRGKRRVLYFGWRYEFGSGSLQKADEIPTFLLPFRDRAAAFAKLSPGELQQVLLTEYPPGAPIGWHRDRSVFGDVVGISLLSSCAFRFRLKRQGGWDRISLIAEPRSAYLLRGAARSEWEHSIPAVERLRYSITFRTLKAK